MKSIMRLLRATFLYLLLFCGFCAPALAEEFIGKITTVLDGDTVLVVREGAQQAFMTVRLAEIDAPEKDQAYGMASRQSLIDMVLNKQVRVTTQAVDNYGRLIGMITLGELNVSHAQVQRGMAWESSRFHNNKPVLALQQEAQQNRRGLWAGANPIAPSIWRKNHAPLSAQPVTQTPSVTQTQPTLSHQTVRKSDCDKRNCAQMKSCDEAKLYFARCPASTLDGDRDGAPCENLCAAEKSKKH